MIAALLMNTGVIAVVVGLHYELLGRLSKLIPKLQMARRARITVGVFGAICGHAVEIWIFAGLYYLQIQLDGFGSLVGNFDGSLLDCVYFSFVSYTTLGYGDVAPTGHIRFLAGTESLVGLVMITWTASFLYVEMANYWKD